MENNQEQNIESLFEDRDHYQSLAQKVKSEIFNDLDKYEKASEEMINFQKANPEIRDFELWHTLIGSTPPGSLVFDSPDRKVSNFVDDLIEKYISK